MLKAPQSSSRDLLADKITGSWVGAEGGSETVVGKDRSGGAVQAAADKKEEKTSAGKRAGRDARVSREGWIREV
jgi:hypothetical protein